MTKENKILSAEDILSADDIKVERVSVPEWGGDVYVKGTNGKEFSDLQASIVEQKGKNQRINLENIQARLVAFCACNEKGERLFKRSQEDLLGKRSSAALQRVFKVAQRLSGLGDEEIEDLVEDLEANPTEDSHSD